MRSVKREADLSREPMDDATRSTVGRAIVGLALGLLVFPFFYVWSVRWGPARAPSNTWFMLYVAVVLVPALLFAALGRARDASA